jgi:hypothetical protein
MSALGFGFGFGVAGDGSSVSEKVFFVTQVYR